MIMESRDWSKDWDKRDRKNEPVSKQWKNFISGFIVGGFTIFAVIFAFDMIMRALFG